MASVNRITLIGRAGADADLRYTPGGDPVTSFNLAVDDRVKEGGEWKKSTQWFRCSLFGKRAEFAAEHVKKGVALYVEGPLQVREYQGNDGQKRFSLDVRLSELQMLTWANDQQDQDDGGQRATREPASTLRRNAVTEPLTNDDIPF